MTWSSSDRSPACCPVPDGALRLSRRARCDVRHAEPGRAAASRPPRGRVAGRGVLAPARVASRDSPTPPRTRTSPRASRGSRRTGRRAAGLTRADREGGRDGRRGRSALPARVAGRDRPDPPRLRQGQRAEPAEPRRHRPGARRDGDRRARPRPDRVRPVFSASSTWSCSTTSSGRHGRIHATVRRGHARVFAFPRPVVAIGGHAVAGGAILALACDERVMARAPDASVSTRSGSACPFPPRRSRSPATPSRRRPSSAPCGKASCSTRIMPRPWARDGAGRR